MSLNYGKIPGMKPTFYKYFLRGLLMCGLFTCRKECGAPLSSVENYQRKFPKRIQNNSASSSRPIKTVQTSGRTSHREIRLDIDHEKVSF